MSSIVVKYSFQRPIQASSGGGSSSSGSSSNSGSSSMLFVCCIFKFGPPAPLHGKEYPVQKQTKHTHAERERGSMGKLE